MVVWFQMMQPPILCVLLDLVYWPSGGSRMRPKIQPVGLGFEDNGDASEPYRRGFEGSLPILLQLILFRTVHVYVAESTILDCYIAESACHTLRRSWLLWLAVSLSILMPGLVGIV